MNPSDYGDLLFFGGILAIACTVTGIAIGAVGHWWLSRKTATRKQGKPF